MGRKFLSFCIFLLCHILSGYSQTKTIDQLKKQIEVARNDQQKLEAIFLLCDQRYSLSSDTLYKYAIESKKINLSGKSVINQAFTDYYVATYYVKAGRLDSALFICQNQLEKLLKHRSDGNVYLKLSALKAQILVRSNKYKEGLSQFYTTLATAERSNDTLMQMIAKNGIGWVHMEMDQNAEALKWFFRALQTSDNIVYHQKNSNIYSNIAAICIATHKNDSADYFVKKAIGFSEKDDNIFFLANSLNILANNYIKTKRPALAKVPLERALKIREQIGDPFYIVSDLSQLALFYAEQSLPAKGIEASLHGIEIAKKYKLFSKLPFLQLGLAKNFKAAGDYLKYGETIEKVLSLKDSVYQLNSEVELAEIRTRYNQQKQENIIIQQQLALNRKNTVLYVAFITVFFAVILTLLLFNNYKRKQRSIVEKIKEEEKRKAKQAVRAAEENERRRISADLHDNLGAYASAISANVDDLVTEYGSINDSAIINIKNNADDIINSLSETIWVLNKTEILITSISDRFKIYVSKIRDAYPEFSININENIITNTTLSPEASLNLLRIMQEAFHNAIKHSRGDSITVEIISDSKIEISIMDNGKGFTNKMGHDGNGIRNMQQRAKANGWYLKIKRLKPTGTAVELGS